MRLARVLVVVLPLVSIPMCVDAHGYLIDPAQRSSLWRVDKSSLRNYNDNALNCGGFHIQWGSNDGKCGACGDPYGMKPYMYDEWGKYDNGIISRTYRQGELINITVELTSAHKGYFVFALCPYGSLKGDSLQECFDAHPLQLSDGLSYSLMGKSAGLHPVSASLPAGLTCDHCVLQWKYRTGNSYGSDEFGSGLGYGQQEHFINCADIAITPSGEAAPTDTTTTSSTTVTDKTTSTSTTASTRPAGGGGDGTRCVGAGAWKDYAAMGDWCVVNCGRGFCPSTHCSCS